MMNIRKWRAGVVGNRYRCSELLCKVVENGREFEERCIFIDNPVAENVTWHDLGGATW